LVLFENILSECNEGNTMYKIKTKAVGRVAAAAALSFGLAASAVSVASASSQGHHSSRHDSGAFTSYQSNRVEGTVSAYVAGTSISILSKDSTTPVVYALTTATTITGLAAGATLASPDRVVLELSTTTPVTVTSIKEKTPCAAKVEGTVSAYVAGTSISILSKDSTTPVVYALTTATTITGLAAGATLASPDRVVLELSTTTPVTVTSIIVGGHGSKCDGSKGNGGSVSLSFGKGGSQSHDFGGRHSGGRGSSRNGNFGR
jgi:predicted hydrolase (HD superfamily)